MSTPGHLADYISFPSKPASIYGLLLTIQSLTGQVEQHGSFTIACNWNSVIQWLNSKQPIDPSVAHADILIASQNITQSLTFNIQFTHIKSHQDTKHTMVLTREAWLNVEADRLAKDHMTTGHTGWPQLQPTMGRMACGNSQQSSGQNLRKQKWDACSGTKAEAYWSKKYRMDQARVKELDTKALEQAMDESMPACHHWVSNT